MITGPTSGIGQAVSLSLAAGGFHIVAAARSEEKASRVIDQVKESGGSAEFLHLRLDDLATVARAARTYADQGRPLDVLVNNAAAGTRRGLTVDGFELQFGVNHLGHFLLTHHLRRTFRPGTRIVNVTSSMYLRAPGIDWSRLQRKTRSPYGLREYAVSKLANILFTREFAGQQPDWRTYAVHPGMTDTSIVPSYAKPFLRGRLQSPEEAAKTVVWCASAQELQNDSGGYFSRMQRREVNSIASDDALANELRKRSEAWCGVSPHH